MSYEPQTKVWGYLRVLCLDGVESLTIPRLQPGAGTRRQVGAAPLTHPQASAWDPRPSLVSDTPDTESIRPRSRIERYRRVVGIHAMCPGFEWAMTVG